MTRADRTRDAMSVLLLLAGVALYSYAWWGMRGLATKQLVIPKEWLAGLVPDPADFERRVGEERIKQTRVMLGLS